MTESAVPEPEMSTTMRRGVGCWESAIVLDVEQIKMVDVRKIEFGSVMGSGDLLGYRWQNMESEEDSPKRRHADTHDPASRSIIQLEGFPLGRPSCPLSQVLPPLPSGFLFPSQRNNARSR